MKLKDIVEMKAWADKFLPKLDNGEYPLNISYSQAKDGVECGLLEVGEGGILRLREEDE